jgi:hypothetical protein
MSSQKEFKKGNSGVLLRLDTNKSNESFAQKLSNLTEKQIDVIVAWD